MQVQARNALPLSFFQRPTLELCRELLGKNLCRMRGGELLRLPITEVEAYDGPEDLASHASRGRTARNSVMFEAGGLWYVYLCYGVHWMLNIVTGDKDYPSAILIRGAGEANGPGKVTKELGIKADFNKRPAIPATGLWMEDAGLHVEEHQVKTCPRVGVGYAGPIWAEKPYRFIWTPDAPKPRRGTTGMGSVTRK
ncbi:MAG: DNA-3-methyladenine glycosylase [Opitutales bacterium]|nr:DNA-3-methyladenine glycosylase [Opitutales bacterium]